MTEPCMSNDSGHYQGSYSERKECGVIGAYFYENPQAKSRVHFLKRRTISEPFESRSNQMQKPDAGCKPDLHGAELIAL
jgi:hypothetical protein